MTRSFLSRPIMTGDNTDPPAIVQGLSVTRKKLLRAVRIQLIFFNDPAFTSVTMKLYADRGGLPAKAISTSSTTRTKASFSPVWGADDHGFVECSFTFPDYALFPESLYHFGLIIAGYTGTQASHIGWANGWPQPIHREGVILEQKEAGRFPLHLAFMGSDF